MFFTEEEMKELASKVDDYVIEEEDGYGGCKNYRFSFYTTNDGKYWDMWNTLVIIEDNNLEYGHLLSIYITSNRGTVMNVGIYTTTLSGEFFPLLLVNNELDNELTYTLHWFSPNITQRFPDQKGKGEQTKEEIKDFLNRYIEMFLQDYNLDEFK